MHDITFTAWLAQIDAILLAAVGLTHSDLPDAPYRDLYDDEASASDTAAEFAQDWWEMPDDIAERVAITAEELA